MLQLLELAVDTAMRPHLVQNMLCATGIVEQLLPANVEKLWEPSR